MKLKVCGITQLAQMQQLEALGVDYAGMIFHEGSKRYPKHLMEQKEEVKNCGIDKIGVFVNASYDTIIAAIEDFNLTGVQLHGDEGDEFCLELMDKATVIKVFRVNETSDVEALTTPFEAVCHYFLFDTASTEYGGSGKKFDWTILEKAEINKHFFLSGGINEGDVTAIKKFVHPNFYGVDVNSGFEIAPGVKDIEKVKNFAKELLTDNVLL